MEQIIKSLEELVYETVAEMSLPSNINAFQMAFETYFLALKPSFERYYPHLGQEVTVDDLKSRFRYETALIHVITEIFTHKAKTDNKQLIDKMWPVFQSESYFSWYRLSEKILKKVDCLTDQLRDINQLAFKLSEATGYIFDRTTKRHFGEFYTPPQIVEHLIELSGFQPSDLINGRKIVDPACGGGIILTAIAEKTIAHGLNSRVPNQHIINALKQNLFGFDIQPFSIAITRTFLLYSCIPLFTLNNPIKGSEFANIELLDPLPAIKRFWTEENGFDYIIGNPPFVSIKREFLDFWHNYQEVLHGHPNLYQLFLWWSVQSVTSNGVVSFLLPQSMLVGLYFKNLRRWLNAKVDILSITRMTDHQGIIGDVDQQMMIISLRRARDISKRPDVEIRVTHNGNDISKMPPKRIAYSKIVQQKGDILLWIVSDNNLDYVIADRLDSQCVSFAELKNRFYFGNGGYVWNQNKKFLLDKRENDSLPLISSANIEPFCMTFPYVGTHPANKRSFSSRVNAKGIPTHSAPIILIKRTTPRKIGRRLIAGISSDSFSDEYPFFYLENHVNYIKPIEGNNAFSLYGLTGWLNSDLVNFIFQLRNGSTQVSAFEMGLLPVNLEIVKNIAGQAKLISNSTLVSRPERIKELNETIFDWLGLNDKHRKRISKVLDRQKP